MMARSYFVVVALLLLAEVSGFEEGASNPGFVARITRKGLEYGKGGKGQPFLWCPLLPTRVAWTRVLWTRVHKLGFFPHLAQKPWIGLPLGFSFQVLSITSEG